MENTTTSSTTPTSSDVIKGKWLEIRDEVRKAFGRLSDDELDKTKGDMKAIGNLIQQKYGETSEKYSKKLADIFDRINGNNNHSMDKAKETFKN